MAGEQFGQETIKRNKDDIKSIFQLIDRIRNRPPLWASLIITVMACAITWLAKG